ncbi:MAG: pyridoxamine 5'-phosphate oxidase family protein [Rhizomicrobium sp.]
MATSTLEKIRRIIAEGNDMTIATIREDGFPQATTVSYIGDGIDICFGTGADSQKAKNIGRCNKVSLTINLPYADWEHIAGISAAGIAQRVTDAAELGRFGALTFAKFPQVLKYVPQGGNAALAVFRIRLSVASLLDYTQGFGHTEFADLRQSAHAA